MKVVAFVPIRLNSKRVIGKNLKLLGEKPLLCYILETLVKIKHIDEVYAYCSSEKILEYLPAGTIFKKRSESLDSDETLGEEIYESFTSEVNADIYILAHTTSPFIKAESIENALEKVIRNDYDSALCAECQKTFAWFKKQPLNYQLNKIPRTQTIEPVYIETSAFYIFRQEIWEKYKQRVGFNPYFQIVDKIEGVDIDNPEDFEFAELVLNKEQVRE